MGKIIDNNKALDALISVGVDPRGVVDFAQQLFVNEAGKPRELTFKQFMTMVLELRETNHAALRDVKHIWRLANKKLSNLHIGITEIKDTLQHLDVQVSFLAVEVRKLVSQLPGEN